MPWTSAVPAAVPSLFHSWPPLVPSSAVKYSVDPTAVREYGFEPAGPVTMSFTITVPAAVPSDFHNSTPLVPSSAGKYRSAPPPLQMRREALDLGVPRGHPARTRPPRG